MLFNWRSKFQSGKLLLDFNLTILVQLEEAKTALEEETRARTKLHGELRNVQSELEHARDQLDDEQEGKAELQRSLTKAMSEASSWRQKYESGEGGIRSVWNCKVRLLLSTNVLWNVRLSLKVFVLFLGRRSWMNSRGRWWQRFRRPKLRWKRLKANAAHWRKPNIDSKESWRMSWWKLKE